MEEFSIDKIPSQKGRIAIVTGANTGLGYETALGLAKKELTVVIACRSRERAEDAREAIIRDTPAADVRVMKIDLGSLASVRNFAKAFVSGYNRLDLLINNAGIMVPPYSRTEDGFESQMGINYFGHFLLTGLLLDIIINTGGSRIVTVSSNAHKTGNINFDDLQWEKHYSRMGGYRQSKLACLMFAYELHRRLEKAGLQTLSVAAHPGVSITELVRHIPKWMIYLFLPFSPLVTHSPEKGALPVLYAALGNDVQGGDYFGPTGYREMKGGPGKVDSTPLSHDLEIARHLWDLSEELTGKKYPV